MKIFIFSVFSFRAKETAEFGLAFVSPDRVRLRLGLAAQDIADSEVAVFIDEAAAYLSNQTGLTLDPNNCTEDQAKAIADLAVIYAYMRVTGVQPSGGQQT